MRGGEAYECEIEPGRRIEVYRAGQDGARVCWADCDGRERWTTIPLQHGIPPGGFRLIGLARPSGTLHDGREVWRVPGPPWGADLTWAGPGCQLILHSPGPRPGWLGRETGPVGDPCRTLADAQEAADAWWLAERAACLTPGGDA